MAHIRDVGLLVNGPTKKRKWQTTIVFHLRLVVGVHFGLFTAVRDRLSTILLGSDGGELLQGVEHS